MSHVDDVRVKAVPVTLADGKVYNIKYDFNAFADLEEKYGTLREALNSLGGEIEKDENGDPIMIKDKEGNLIKDKEGKSIPQRKVSIRGVRNILHVGLLHEHPEMTEREAGVLIGGISGMNYLAPKLTEAMEAAMPRKPSLGEGAATGGETSEALKKAPGQ